MFLNTTFLLFKTWISWLLFAKESSISIFVFSMISDFLSLSTLLLISKLLGWKRKFGLFIFFISHWAAERGAASSMLTLDITRFFHTYYRPKLRPWAFFFRARAVTSSKNGKHSRLHNFCGFSPCVSIPEFVSLKSRLLLLFSIVFSFI